MDKQEQAMQYFKDGYNCCQAVVLPFASELQMDEKTALKIASSFGGGMGRMREVCGAVSAMFMVAGVVLGYDDPKAKKEKTDHYALIQLLAADFRELNGSIVCRELLGIDGASGCTPSDRNTEFYQKRPCIELVGQAAAIIEKHLKAKGKI